MITLPNKTYTADAIHLSQILGSTTKVNMLKVCKKFDLYVSPNLKKDETARRIANEVIDNPIEIISRLSKVELQILDEFVTGDYSTYVVRKERKTPYILQKYFMVVTYCDEEKDNGICSCQPNFASLSPMTIKYTSTLLCKARKDRRQKT